MINHVQGQTTKLHTIHPILDYPAPLYSTFFIMPIIKSLSTLATAQ